MHAILGFLAIGFAAPVALGSDAAVPSSTLAWIVGLACGVGLMVAIKVDWRDLPQQAWTWVRSQRLEMQWATFGFACLGIIHFY